MTRYKRKWKCAVCNKDVIFDSKKKTLACGCGVYPCTFVNLNVFEPLEKEAELLKEKKEA